MLMGLMLVTREKRIPAPIKLTVRPLKGLVTTSLDSKQIRRCVVHMKERTRCHSCPPVVKSHQTWGCFIDLNPFHTPFQFFLSWSLGLGPHWIF